MKIGIFTDCYYPQINGVVTSIINLEEMLKKRGHEVYIITPAVKNFTDKDSKHIIRIFSIPFLKWSEFRIGLFLKYTKIYNKVKNLNFDIIHTQTEFTMGAFGKLIAKDLNIPLLHTYHTVHEEYTHYISNIGQKQLKKIAKFFAKKYIHPFSGVIVPSIKTKKLLESYGIKNNIYVVPNGINLDNFKKEISPDTILQLKKSLGLKDDSFKIIFLGRISKEKNIDMLVNALTEVVKKNNAELIIVGDGPHKIELEEKVKTLGLTKNVFFTNKIPNENVPRYYKLADLFISPSKTETQGLTIIEAMAANIPVLVYDDTNIDGIVLDKKTGLLFKTDEELIEKIQFAVEHKTEIAEYAKKGITIVDEFSSQKFAEKIEKIYIDTINNSKR